MSSLELLTCMLLIGTSSYLSASETALFSLSKFQLRFLKEHFKKTYQYIKNLLSNPSGLLLSILIVNEVVNISISSMITRWILRKKIIFPDFLSQFPTWILELILGLFIITPFLLIFCEITPKIIGVRMNQLIALLTARPLFVIYKILSPLIILFKKIIHLFSFKMITQEPLKKETEDFLKASDFLLMVEQGRKEGSIQKHEVQLIHNVFDLDRITVGQIATPIAQAFTLPIQTNIKDAIHYIKNNHFSRIPVISQKNQKVVGILYAKDLIRFRIYFDSTLETIEGLLRQPFFVSAKMSLNSLFNRLKKNKIHMAIVKDLPSDSLGVVTMNDVLETLFDDFNPYEEEFETIHTASQHEESGS